MMRLMGAMEIFTSQQQEDIKDEVSKTSQKTNKGQDFSQSTTDENGQSQNLPLKILVKPLYGSLKWLLLIDPCLELHPLPLPDPDQLAFPLHLRMAYMLGHIAVHSPSFTPDSSGRGRGGGGGSTKAPNQKASVQLRVAIFLCSAQSQCKPQSKLCTLVASLSLPS